MGVAGTLIVLKLRQKLRKHGSNIFHTWKFIIVAVFVQMIY